MAVRKLCDTITTQNLKGMETPINTEPRQPRPKPVVAEEPADAASKYPESAPNSSPSDPEVMRRLYANMLSCRLARERARTLLHQGRLTNNGWEATGSEAIEVGATFELRADDALALYQRDVVAHSLKGWSLKQVFAQLLGSRKVSQRQSVPDPCLASNIIPPASSIVAQFNVAAGVAWACKQRAQRNVVLAIFGDGFDSLGSWHEAAKLAGEYRLPLIFVVESDRQRYQSSNHWFGEPGDLSDRAHEYGFPGIPVDGDDVVAVFRVTQESIHRARNGAGPTLIECKSSRAVRDSGARLATNGTRRKAAARRSGRGSRSTPLANACKRCRVCRTLR
jgi:TPP-dependent pyruvate/acetoin dehydrogenase alpha subunit